MPKNEGIFHRANLVLEKEHDLWSAGLKALLVNTIRNIETDLETRPHEDPRCSVEVDKGIELYLGDQQIVLKVESKKRKIRTMRVHHVNMDLEFTAKVFRALQTMTKARRSW